MRSKIADIIPNIIFFLILATFTIVNISFSLITTENIKFFLLSIGVIILGIVIIFEQIITQPKSSFKVDWIELAWAAFLIWIFLTNYKRVGYQIFPKMFPLFVLGFLLILLRRTTAKVGKDTVTQYFIYCLAALGIYQSLFGLTQFLFDKDELGIYKTVISGTILYPNAYASFLSIGMVCTILILIKAKNRITRVLCGIILALEFSVLLLNGSRGAFISILMASVICFYINLSKQDGNSHKLLTYLHLSKRGFLILSVGVLLGLTILLITLNKNSSLGRVFLMKISSEMIVDNLLAGIGFKNYSYEFLNYQREFLLNPINATFTHKALECTGPNNQFLKMATELGIVGGVLFLLIWGFVIRRGILCIRGVRDKKLKGFYNVLLIILLSISIHSIFDDIFNPIVISFTVLFTAAILPDNYIKIRLSKLGKLGIKIINIAFVVLLIWQSGLYIKHYPAFKYERYGYFNILHGRYVMAEANLREALMISPDSEKCKSYMGRALIGCNRAKSSEGVQVLEDIEEGVTLLKNLENTYHSRDYYLALSLGLLKIGKNKDALTYAEKVHQMFPEQLRPCLLLGIVNYYLGNSQEAIYFLNKCQNTDLLIENSTTKNIKETASILSEAISGTDTVIYNFETPKNSSFLAFKLDSILLAH